MTIVIVLALSVTASFLFLRFAHEQKWFYASVAVIFASVFAGRLLGERVWPYLGAIASAIVLRIFVIWGRRRGARLVITPHADFVPGRFRQTWESMAFASGLAVLAGASLLFITQGTSASLPWLSLGAFVICAGLTFLIVPHWVFARLGLRMWEPTRFVVRSLSESYASFVQVSNGTLLVFAVFYGANVLAGQVSRLQGYLTVVLTILGVMVLALTVFGTAAAYFRHHEEAVVKRVAAEARRLGFTGIKSDLVRPPH